MSFRGASRGRGGSFGGSRGGSSFGGRGGKDVPLKDRQLSRLTACAGRGGFQPSYGPPASVLGLFRLNLIWNKTDLDRDGLVRPCLRRRNGLRVRESKNPLLQCAYISREQGTDFEDIIMGGYT